ncbi:MAG: hypothetical protein ACPL8I_07590, partial [Chloroflexaceae bacterium]
CGTGDDQWKFDLNRSSRVIGPLPPFRQLVMDGMGPAGRKRCIHGLRAVDITASRRRLHRIKQRTGESLLFTGFSVCCCARAVGKDEHLYF